MAARTRPIGLVGGLGPAATAIYYQRLVEAAAEADAVLDLTISHADVRHVLSCAQAGDVAGLARHIGGHLSRLKAAGAEVFAIGAVTPHLCAPELGGEPPRVDLVETLDRALADSGDVFALMGTRAVVGTAMFGRLHADVATPSDALIDRAHAAYVRIVERRAVDAELAGELRAVASAVLAETGADALVLAGTELALAPPETWDGLSVLDCTPLHVAAIVETALNEERPSSSHRASAVR